MVCILTNPELYCYLISGILQFMMSSELQWRIKKQIKVYVNQGINQTL